MLSTFCLGKRQRREEDKLRFWERDTTICEMLYNTIAVCILSGNLCIVAEAYELSSGSLHYQRKWSCHSVNPERFVCTKFLYAGDLRPFVCIHFSYSRWPVGSRGASAWCSAFGAKGCGFDLDDQRLFTPSALERRQSLPVWPPTLNKIPSPSMRMKL